MFVLRKLLFEFRMKFKKREILRFSLTAFNLILFNLPVLLVFGKNILNEYLFKLRFNSIDKNIIMTTTKSLYFKNPLCKLLFKYLRSKNPLYYFGKDMILLHF